MHRPGLISIVKVAYIGNFAAVRWPRVLAACLLLCGLTGCVSYSTTGQSTGQMKQQINDSLFYKSTKFFYPGDAPDNPRQIAQMTLADLVALESEFDARLKQVVGLHVGNREILAKVFGEAVAKKPVAKLQILNRNLAEAQTLADGEINIDVRVIHAMLQSSLLVAFEAEVSLQRIKTGKKIEKLTNFSPDEEKLVVDHVLGMRKVLDQTRGQSIIGDLRRADLAERGKPSTELDWFGMSSLLNDFNRAAVRYDVQSFYLLAHEVGHVVLDHFGEVPVVMPASEDEVMDECSLRRAKERAADYYATVLITLASAPQATADIIPFEAFGSVPVFEGFDTFFEYAYGYAGFKTNTNASACNYPSPVERLASAQSTYKKIRDVQINTILKKADTSK